MTHQADSRPMSGHWRASVATAFVVCTALLALVGPLSMFFWPIEHGESATETASERDHSDWLLS